MRPRYYALLIMGILLIVLLLVMTTGRAQALPGFTDINTAYRWKKGIFQDYMGTPSGPVPALNGGPSARPGALFYCTTDSNYYSYIGGGRWTVVGKDTSAHIVYIPNTLSQVLANSNVIDRPDSVNSGAYGFGIVTDNFFLRRSAAGIPWLRTDTQGLLFPGLATTDTTLFFAPDAQGRLGTRHVRLDLSAYYSRTEVDTAKTNLRAETAQKLSGKDTLAIHEQIVALQNKVVPPPDLSPYLLSADAAAAYAPKTALNAYLLGTDAANTYATKTSLGSYLLSTTAAGLYVPLASLSNYLLITSANSTYATILSLNNYLSTATAASTYLKQADAATVYATVASLNSYLLGTTAATIYLRQADAAATYYDKSTIDTKLSAFRTSVTVDGVTITGNGNATPLAVVNDATHRFSTDTEKTTWNSRVSPVGSGDIEITDFTHGIILRTADGTRARITLLKYNGVLTLSVSDPL